MMRSYKDEDLKRAVSAIKDAGMSIREASKLYAVPFNTIRRRVNGSVDVDCKRPGPKPFLGTKIEKEIYECIVQLQKMGHGLSRREILNFAGEIDSKNEVKMFKNGIPSKRWYKSFMMRHNLSLRKPENLSIARSSMATEETKVEFFTKLSDMIENLNITGINIYNVDESGLTMVNKSGKIIAPKGSKTVVMKKSGERSENITVVAACNATASVILPPMIIYKGVRMNDDLMKDAPEDSIFGTSPKGYIDSELFYMWFVKFMARIPSKRPVLLLLDGHSSHLSRQTLLLARENNIHFLMFPPHTTHIFQPLDVGVFGPLKKAFSEECTKLMRKNKKKALNRYDFCKVLRPAWEKSVTPANILGGFRGSGIWPLNPNAIHPERLNNQVIAVATSSNGCNVGDQAGSSTNSIQAMSPVLDVLTELFRPEESRQKRPRQITRTRCVTSDEFVKEQEEKQNKTKKRRVEKRSKNNSEHENDYDKCAECGGAYADDCHGESWIQCSNCKLWYHQTCQHLSNSAKPKQFQCFKCK